MNFAAILTTILPLLLQLLNDPAFQAVIKAVEAHVNQQIAGGVHPTTAATQATGLLGAAAMLHLTGNPVTDFQVFLKNLPLPPAPSPGKTFP
jgi:hypothetical protein